MSKTHRRERQQGNERTISAPVAEVRDELYGMSVTELALMNESLMRELKETVSDTTYRAFEAQQFGWMKLATMKGQAGRITEDVRRDIVTQSRYMGKFDPFCKQGLELWANFGVGAGIAWSSEREDVQTVLDAISKDARNKPLLNCKGQRILTKKFVGDGELYVAVFNGQGGNPPRIRIIDSLEIMAIGTDPEDECFEVGYRREWVTPDNKKHTAYYRSAQAVTTGYSESSSDVVYSDGKKQEREGSEFEDNVAVLHWQLDDIQGRGTPGLSASLDAAYCYRQFQRSRVSVQQAIAKVATKEVIDGGVSKVNAIAASRAAQQAARERANNTPSTAEHRVENKSATYEALPQETGAASAKVDGEMLATWLGAGFGIMPHYLGFGDLAILATAQAMEVPMLRTFEALKGALYDIVSETFQYACWTAGITDIQEKDIHLDIPDIYPENQTALLAATVQAMTAIPALMNSADVIQLVLNLMQFDDPKSVYERIQQEAADKAEKDEAKATERMEQQEKLAQMKAANPATPEGSFIQGMQKVAQVQEARLREIREAKEHEHDA